MSETKPCHELPYVVCPKCDPLTAINHLYVVSVEAGVDVKKAWELAKHIEDHMSAALSPRPSPGAGLSEEIRAYCLSHSIGYGIESKVCRLLLDSAAPVVLTEEEKELLARADSYPGSEPGRAMRGLAAALRRVTGEKS